MDKLLKRWEYSLPSDTDQLKQFSKELLELVLKLQQGEVINGTLKGMIDPKDVQELME